MTSTCEGVLEYDRHTHLSDRWFQSVHTRNGSDADLRRHEGRAHDHYLVGTTVPERLRGGARWRIRTGARHKSFEQRRGLSSSGCWRQPFELA